MDNLVFHARVSDYKGYPTCGYKIQAEIEKNEKAKKQKREELEKKELNK